MVRSPVSASRHDAANRSVRSTMSSEESSNPDAGNPNLSPLEGGRWRPVRPDELIRREVTNPPDWENQDGNPDAQHRVTLQRRQELEHKQKSNPTDLDGFLELADIYRAEERPLEAKRLLTQAAEIFPEDLNIRFQLEEAILARSLQQFREVSELATRLQSAEAERELERSRSDWAFRRMEVCRARLERDPNQTQIRLSLVEAMFDAEMFEDAFSDAHSLLEKDAYAPQAHFLRAKCLIALGKEVEAMKELRAIAMRRAVVAPLPLKTASLEMLCELADKYALDATGTQYREMLKRLEDSPHAENTA